MVVHKTLTGGGVLDTQADLINAINHNIEGGDRVGTFAKWEPVKPRDRPVLIRGDTNETITKPLRIVEIDKIIVAIVDLVEPVLPIIQRWLWILHHYYLLKLVGLWIHAYDCTIKSITC